MEDEYTLLSDYITSNKHINIKHNICGHEYTVKANNFLNGQRCPKCAKIQRANTKRRTTEKFKEDLKDVRGNEFEVLGKYVRNNETILVKHKCGYEYYALPSNLLLGSGCPKCSSTPPFSKRKKLLNLLNLYILHSTRKL